MRKFNGFVCWNEQRRRFEVDWRKTLSIVVGELLLQEILAACPYIRGYLLDVGCGSRPYAPVYESLVKLSVGVDVPYSPHGTSAVDVIAPAEHLPFADRVFDVILCTEVLEHTLEPVMVMREFARLLKPGGFLLLSVPFIYPLHEAPYDYWRFTSYGLRHLCQKAGFEVIYIHTKGSIGATLMVLYLNLMIRGLNAISKLLRLVVPLRERKVIRWILALPQWVYLTLCKISTLNIWRTISSQLSDFLTLGYFLVARKAK